ncbi:hypothetical protein FY528_11865 [Hymenobacter lutimineralis]|uniref:Carboxypeptidase regulatory-like domain-containing protein n=1 Tax=Hymenobacter lutimineralis TaxID=2606448 RepID=A0A5D6V0X5_9BACT|nr:MULTISPECIES: carboxypeptidase regulatory-like domain-containing protein [Hymenobacter]QIX61392.1 hypothetical protein HER32_09460 [Hymenobacter sp. BT18]TYZ08905.1 hypothetical protein FY528_11865 [Hymenobacter lutimineralis]
MHRAFTFFFGLGLFLLTPASLFAQTTVAEPTAAPAQALGCAIVTGTVTDESNNPLTGATVEVPGIKDAFITNSEGRYIIMTKTPLPRNARLQVSAGGYEAQELVLVNCEATSVALHTLPGTRFKRDGRIKKTSSTGKIW